MTDLLGGRVDAQHPRNGFERNGAAKDPFKRPPAKLLQRKRPLSNATSNKPRR